ncbi:MAG: RNA polymerase sigma factor [Ktedonobacteraceae bacterium]|nr:RNA polymerase sigma factor [Ktedonobacteraceae bacterium]MBO0793526.1 RNA polymerase sigma factor [Ktedonobacteraceae bacterium]
MDVSDNELPGLLAKDLPRYYRQVVLRYQARLYTLALRLTGSPQDAEDVVQEALISAYISLENYPTWRIETLKLQAWLYRVTLNVFNHYARGARLHLLSLRQEGDDLEVEDCESERPEALFESHERRQELEALVAELPVRYRIAVACYYFEEMSYQEVADLLEQPVGTVKSTIHRGIRLLRTMLTDERREETWSQNIASKR